MADPKEKRTKQTIPVREPHKRTKTGIFDNLRQLPHPVEEFLGDVPSRPRDQDTEQADVAISDITGPIDITSPVENRAKAHQFARPADFERPLENGEAPSGLSPADLAELSFAGRPD